MIVLVWLLRFLVYGGLAVLSLGVIAPAVGGGLLGLLITAPLAGVAIMIDLWLTAKWRKTSIDKIVSSRMLLADSVLSGEKNKEQNQPLELEASVVEIYEIEPDGDISKESQDN